MTGVRRLSDAAAPHLIVPQLGPGVCGDCFNLTRGYGRCFACTRGQQRLAAFLPVSYSIAGGPLHRALAASKRDADPFVPVATATIAAILWRFLERHEQCVAAMAGVDRFDLVTTVPSGERSRDARHPLRRIVGQLVGPTRERHAPLLARTEAEVQQRQFDARRFAATGQLSGAAVLLIDDTWTSGASAQSAAAALVAAGARRVGCVVIGRHLNPAWDRNEARLQPLRGRFGYDQCALCAGRGEAARAA